MIFTSDEIKAAVLPHPARPQRVALGRTERSAHLVPVEFREVVDVEKGLDLMAKLAAPEPVVPELELVDYSTRVSSWGMLGNSSYGDCTCASVAHGNMIFDAMVGAMFAVTENNVLRMYEQSGWKPGDPSSDRGWTLQAAAEYDRTIGLLGTKDAPAPDIEAYANVALDDDDAQQVAMGLFGGLSAGCVVTEAAMNQFREGRPWQPVAGSPELGGHAIWKASSHLDKTGKFVTWGAVQEASEAWEKESVDEYLAFVPTLWRTRMPEAVLRLGIVDYSKLESLVGSYES